MCSLDVAQPSATVRNRPQPSATVRNRSRDCYMAVPMVSSAAVVIFGGFRRLVASFRVAGVALRDIQTCFVTCRNPSYLNEIIQVGVTLQNNFLKIISKI